MTDPILRGYVIFCDDIRHEFGGKLTFVGVYDGIMYAHGDFPFMLPKFGIAIRYMELRDAGLKDDVTIRIYMPGQDENGEPAFGGTLPTQELRDTIKPHPDVDPGLPRYLNIGTNLIFAPLIIPQKGMIKVRAVCGSEMLKVGSLLVTSTPTETPGAS
jgi:hypothetical protein